MRGMMGGLYRVTEWIMRFSVSNVMWMICSFPFFLFSLVLITGQSIEPAQLIGVLLVVATVTPFTLFPATAALFSSVRKWIMNDEEAPLIRTFFRSYKENYLQSMFGGIIFTIFFGLIIANYFFYNGLETQLQAVSVLFIVLFVLLSISVFNFFCILAHMHMKTIPTIKNAVLITIGRPFTSLMIIITNAVVIYVSLTQFNLFLAFFFMGSLVAYMTFHHFYRMFLKIQEKQEAFEEQQAKEEQSTIDNASDEFK